MYKRDYNVIIDENGKRHSYQSVNRAKKRSREIQISDSHEFDDAGKKGLGRGRVRIA